MASQAITQTRHGLSVGAVFGRSINVIKANPVATLGVTFVLVALPQFGTQALIGRASFARDLQDGAYLLFGTYGFVVGLLWLVASGALVHAAVAHDQGRSANLGEVLTLGARRALPLFAVNTLFFFGIWLGALFLLVPGIILAVMWSVSLPAVVAERTGVFGAFGRSRSLTQGARWPIFGIGLLACFIYLVVSVVIGAATVAGYGSFGALTGGGAVRVATTPSLMVELLQSIVTTVMLTWFTLVGASLFIELRHSKDGPDVDRLTEIFA